VGAVDQERFIKQHSLLTTALSAVSDPHFTCEESELEMLHDLPEAKFPLCIVWPLQVPKAYPVPPW
jgi:hypothetical protein